MLSLLHKILEERVFLTREALTFLNKVLEEKVSLTREEALEYLKIGKAHSEGFRFWSTKLGRGFRSSWEVELAELMTELGIKWEYEPRRFYFWRERESYLPDFYLPDWNVWIEVKGFMDKKSARRIRLFKKYYGKEYGFLLYESAERELVMKNPSALFVLLEIAQKSTNGGSESDDTVREVSKGSSGSAT